MPAGWEAVTLLDVAACFCFLLFRFFELTVSELPDVPHVTPLCCKGAVCKTWSTDNEKGKGERRIESRCAKGYVLKVRNP